MSYPNWKQLIEFTDWYVPTVINQAVAPKYDIMYTVEKLKSLEGTLKFRKSSYEDILRKLDNMKDSIKSSGLNTLKNSVMLETISDTQNIIRTELGFNRAFLDDVLRQRSEKEPTT